MACIRPMPNATRCAAHANVLCTTEHRLATVKINWVRKWGEMGNLFAVAILRPGSTELTKLGTGRFNRKPVPRWQLPRWHPVCLSRAPYHGHRLSGARIQPVLFMMNDVSGLSFDFSDSFRNLKIQPLFPGFRKTPDKPKACTINPLILMNNTGDILY